MINQNSKDNKHTSVLIGNTTLVVDFDKSETGEIAKWKKILYFMSLIILIMDVIVYQSSWVIPYILISFIVRRFVGKAKVKKQ